MKRLLPYITVLLLAGCAGNTSRFAEDYGDMSWPLFRSDPALSGYTDRRLPDNPKLLWSYSNDLRTVSSPIVYNGTTYWCNRSGLILGVDMNGRLRFEYDMKTAVEATPMISDSILYIGRIDGFMSAISLKSRSTVWEFETYGQISASPNIAELRERSTIIFGSYDNYLYCVDAKTGEEIDRFESGYYINGAVALWNDHAVFGGCDAWLRIIDCQSGITTDSLELDAYVPASPAIMGNYCYVGDYSGSVYKIILNRGKIDRYSKIIEGGDDNGSFVSVSAVSADMLYILSADRYLYAISRKDGSVKWKYLLKGSVGESSPVVAKDKVIVCTKTGIVSILDADNGKLLWEYDTGEQILGSPAILKDRFMILSSRGTLFCFGNE